MHNNYCMQEVHSHLVLWSKSRVFTSTQMSTCNDSLQAEHSIMVQSDLLGILQVHKTGTFRVDFIFFSFLRPFLTGNDSAFSAPRHLIRWGRNLPLVKTKLPDSFPLASAAADARVNSPQSTVPFESPCQHEKNYA